MLAIGSVLADSYRIESELGRGGMSVVYVAQHLRLPTRVAIKVMQSHLTDDVARARFRREAEVLAGLKHPHIVTAYDFNEVDGHPYLVMEHLDGEDLASRIKRDRKLPLDEVLELARQIGDGLQAAHDRGIVHRDLKPQNVFLCRPAGATDKPIVKLLDFGISKLIDNSEALTKSALSMGTPSYMSPEQARGESSSVDARADQFSFAVLLYELLSGLHPFRRDVPLVTMSRIVSVEVAPIEGVPDAVMKPLLRALRKRPAERFASVLELVDALERGAGKTRSARGPSRTWRAFVLVVALALAAAASVVAMARWRADRRAIEQERQTIAKPPVAPAVVEPPPPAATPSLLTPSVPPNVAPHPAATPPKRHVPHKPPGDQPFRLEDPFPGR